MSYRYQIFKKVIFDDITCHHAMAEIDTDDIYHVRDVVQQLDDYDIEWIVLENDRVLTTTEIFT